ncbi:MAG: cytochrome d ubiquinol oxidase subunit II [Alphaproteobacteria bacterium]|nr:cytochrome d ubiquinol oxidase subunit II [Alphaproteobacteria bacterium]
MHLFGDPAIWLPLAFAGLMGLSILIYVILDGFDLGVGILMPWAEPAERDLMVASIGPFWDANETWLVLAIGLLLVAFPVAHGAILSALYLPVAIMLLGLILRGVAFELRVKAPGPYRQSWNRAFVVGSAMTALSQGFMLGLYIMGLEWRWDTVLFACLVALCVAAGYGFIGASWLIIKTSGDLQRKAVAWAKRGLLGVVAGFVAISFASPLVSPRIFAKWFSVPEIFLLAPLPLMSLALVGLTWIALRHLPDSRDRFGWIPFASGSTLFVLAFVGLAYSFYPFVVPEKITLYEAASAPESLIIILAGAVFVLPAILAYTALAYFVFRGKATELRYD